MSAGSDARDNQTARLTRTQREEAKLEAAAKATPLPKPVAKPKPKPKAKTKVGVGTDNTNANKVAFLKSQRARLKVALDAGNDAFAAKIRAAIAAAEESK